jgi:hypothetical protein
MPENRSPIKVAVVTGGHSYDVPNFHRLMASLGQIEPYIQPMDDFAASPAEVREAYDVVAFYIMLMDGPSDEGHPWWAGKPKSALEALGQTKQGILVLHHATLAYPQWPLWNELAGIADRSFGYHIGESIHVKVAAPGHPILEGVKDWDMIDETYTMAEPGPDSRTLLTVEHPKSMKSIAWTRQYRASRVLNFQSGHDNQTWQNPSFRRVLERGMLWCAGRL